MLVGNAGEKEEEGRGYIGEVLEGVEEFGSCGRCKEKGEESRRNVGGDAGGGG